MLLTGDMGGEWEALFRMAKLLVFFHPRLPINLGEDGSVNSSVSC